MQQWDGHLQLFSTQSYEAFDSFLKMPLGLNLLSLTSVSGVADLES